ncbi:MAG TPA: HAD family hydrolase [Terriglobales bacterium]|nr:HAD family hydrolase [Terriglobales bacterium]
MGWRAIFFDAGNTLIFPTPELFLAPLRRRSIGVTQEQLYAAEREAKRLQDEAATHGSVDHSFWNHFYSHLLGELGIQDGELQAELIAAARDSHSWMALQPGTRETLLRLKQRFRLGVISNADGRIAQLFAKLGLADCFDSITDSGLVGHEKPDGRIFAAAMQSLGAQAGESVYVGDIYSVDYTGASAAGMTAVLFDRAGAYRDSGLPRVASLGELEQWLNRGR